MFESYQTLWSFQNRKLKQKLYSKQREGPSKSETWNLNATKFHSAITKEKWDKNFVVGDDAYFHGVDLF